MLSLFAAAAAGSGVAQAQSCQARAKNTGMVRAEGITEVVADIELRCGRPEANNFGFIADIPATLEIAVELNTNITNEISDERAVSSKPPHSPTRVAESTWWPTNLTPMRRLRTPTNR